MHIILLILKILGIILLSVLGLVLTLVLPVLFVPVRYRLEAEKHPGDAFRARFGVSWLLHLIRVSGSFDGKNPSATVRVAFFTLKRIGEEPARAAKKKTPEDTHGIKETSKPAQDHALSEAEGPAEPDKKEEVPESFAESLKNESVSETPQKNRRETAIQNSDNINRASKPDPARIEKRIEKTAAIPERQNDSPGESNPTSLKEKAVKIFRRKEKRFKENDNAVQDDVKTAEEVKAEKARQRETKLTIIGEKIASVFRLLCSIPQRLADLITDFLPLLAGLPESSGSIFEKIEDLQKKVRPYMTPRMKKLFGRILNKVIRLLRHYLPRRMKGYLHFGTGDPNITGRIVGILFLILPARADRYDIQPEFTDAVFDTDTALNGRIRLCHVVGMGISLLLDKQFRRLLHLVMHRGKD